MIQIAELERKIREQAGEIEILRLQLAGKDDDLRIANERIASLTQPVVTKSSRRKPDGE